MKLTEEETIATFAALLANASNLKEEIESLDVDFDDIPMDGSHIMLKAVGLVSQLSYTIKAAEKIVTAVPKHLRKHYDQEEAREDLEICQAVIDGVHAWYGR